MVKTSAVELLIPGKLGLASVHWYDDRAGHCVAWLTASGRIVFSRDSVCSIATLAEIAGSLAGAAEILGISPHGPS